MDWVILCTARLSLKTANIMLVLENDLQSPPLRGLVGDEILFKSSVAGRV